MTAWDFIEKQELLDPNELTDMTKLFFQEVFTELFRYGDSEQSLRFQP